MATPPDNHQEPLKYQTWTLKVPIHCEGCKKKVRKILQSMDGVYMTTIDSQQHKVIVTGNIEAETLLKKLSKSGKPAQLWPDNKPKEMIQEPPPNMEGDKDKPKPTPESNDEQVNQNPENIPTDPNPPSPDQGGNDQDGQTKKKKKKKNKGKNGNSTDTVNVPSGEAPQPPSPQSTPPPESTPPPPLPDQAVPPPPPPESMEPPPPPPPGADAPPQGPPMEQEKIPIESLNLGPPPMQHEQALHPYFRPPVNNPAYMHMPPLAHNPPPAPLPMGVSYSMAQPRTSGSYYVPPTYPHYAYPHNPMMHNIPLPPPPRPINDYYDDHVQYGHRDYNDDAASQCRLM